MTTGIERIAEEREEQKQRWSAKHDATHKWSELVRAALVYALAGAGYYSDQDVKDLWPWTNDPKFGSRIYNLTKAGALIAAEIDRLQDNHEETKT